MYKTIRCRPSESLSIMESIKDGIINHDIGYKQSSLKLLFLFLLKAVAWNVLVKPTKLSGWISLKLSTHSLFLSLNIFKIMSQWKYFSIFWLHRVHSVFGYPFLLSAYLNLLVFIKKNNVGLSLRLTCWYHHNCWYRT